MSLTAQEIQLFRHNGFVKFPTRLPEDQVTALKEAALADIRNGVEPVARQGERIIRISDLWGRGGIFQQTITCDDILNPLESIVGPPTLSSVSIGTITSICETAVQPPRWKSTAM